jgi:hypothetical protein
MTLSLAMTRHQNGNDDQLSHQLCQFFLTTIVAFALSFAINTIKLIPGIRHTFHLIANSGMQYDSLHTSALG